MKETFRRAFGFIWALWAAMWFMVVVIIFTPLYAIFLGIFGRRLAMTFVWINTHYLCPFLLFMSGVRIKVFGRENINPKGTYVYASNHLTQLDILVTGAALPQPIKFLAKSEIKYVPFFGYMTKMLAIMVDRKNKESREKSVQYMVDELQRGNSIFLYVEGTRNRTPQPLKEFKDGAFRIAIIAQIPVMVQTLIGTKTLNNPKGIQLYPGTAEVYYSKPIETTGMTLDDMPRLKERVKEEMMRHL